jgi:predicted ATPase
VEVRGGFFVSGKFDSLDRPETSYPLIRAFEDFVQQLTERPDQDKYKHIYVALKGMAETDHLLTEMLPALRRFQTNGKAPRSTGDTMSGLHAQVRVAVAFCRLFQVICSSSIPLVLFLDDLQWAKPAPLQIMSALLRDQDIHGLVLLGACRGNEVPTTHHLSVTLRDLEDAKGLSITDIRLSSLDESTVGSMVCDAVGHDDPDISKFIWEQGGGNIFFTVQMIHRVLGDSARKMRQVSLENFRYGSAVDLLTEVIHGLPPDVQDILRIGACFGAEFDANLLEDLVVCDVEGALVLCQDQELIRRGRGGTVWFAHDQIQQSAYALIPEERREATHLDIGRRLWDSLSEDELKTYGFAVVRQLRLGANLMTDEGERYRMSDLLLRAGKHAIQTGSFDEAASHFDLGISLLGYRHWRDEYYLSLELHNGAARVAYCCASYDRVQLLTNTILANARLKAHKMKAFTLLMEALAAKSDIGGAIELGLDALSENDCAIPKNVGVLQILFEVAKTKRLLRRYSDDRIKELPRINDESEEAGIVHLMMNLQPYTISAGLSSCILIPLRAVQMILKHGLCSDSPAVFAVLGLFLANHLGDYELGLRLGKLSMDLLQHLEVFEDRTRIVLISHSYIFSIQQPLKDLLGPMQSAHLAGLSNGKFEMAMICASNRTGMAIIASSPLGSLIDDMRTSLNLMIGHQGGDALGVAYLLPSYQFARNMVYPSENPGELTGDVMDEQSFQAAHEGDGLALGLVSFYKLLLACYFQDFMFAEFLVEQVEKGLTGFPPYLRVAFLLYSGIAHAALSSNRTRKRLRRVKKCVGTIKRFVRASNDRSSNGRYDAQIHMLEAEIAGIKGKTDEAITKFAQVLDCAHKEGFANLAALAHERAAALLVDAGRPKQARAHLVQAVREYKLWGADAKVAQLLVKLPVTLRKEWEPIQGTQEMTLSLPSQSSDPADSTASH